MAMPCMHKFQFRVVRCQHYRVVVFAASSSFSLPPPSLPHPSLPHPSPPPPTPQGTLTTTDLAELVAEEEEEDGEESESEKNRWDFTPNRKDQRFSAAVREVFCSYFVQHFANYDTFIVVPTQTYEQWIKNREQFQNFDNTAFLSDQPNHHWPFYAAFLESGMFTTFIDEKVTSMWHPEMASQTLTLFDSRVEAYRDKTGLGKSPTTPGLSSRSSSKSTPLNATSCVLLFCLLHYQFFLQKPPKT